MMSARTLSRRARVGALLVLAAAMVAGLIYVHRSASAWSEAAAARTAIATILAAIEEAETPASPPAAEGHEATEAEAAEIDEVANAYLGALEKADLEAAWQLLHPDSRGGLTLEQWQQERVAAIEAEAWYQDELDAINLLLLGDDFELGEIITEMGSGWARIVMTVEVPCTLMMRRAGDDWAVDLAATRDAEARVVIERQLKNFGDREQTFQSLMMAMMGNEAGYVPVSIADLARLPMAEVNYEVASRRVSGDTACVTIEGSARLHVAMPLAYGERGWSIAWCQQASLIEPETTLAEAIRGEGGPSGPSGPPTTACQSNLRQVAQAALMYSSDYDQRFPIADRWAWALHPYCRNSAIHHCPADEEEYSYAMNYKLSRQLMGKVRYPAETVLFFESHLGVPNAWDGANYPGTSLCDPPRHDGGNNYAFVDSHVAWYAPDSPMVARDAYKPFRERSLQEHGSPELMMEEGMPPGMPMPPEEGPPPPGTEGPPAPPQALGREP